MYLTKAMQYALYNESYSYYKINFLFLKLHVRRWSASILFMSTTATAMLLLPLSVLTLINKS